MHRHPSPHQPWSQPLERQREDVVTEGPRDDPRLPGKESDTHRREDLPPHFGMLDVEKPLRKTDHSGWLINR
jgi:hypothetical protein